jgi:hypothetical protein
MKETLEYFSQDKKCPGQESEQRLINMNEEGTTRPQYWRFQFYLKHGNLKVLFYPENGDSRFLRHFDIYLLVTKLHGVIFQKAIILFLLLTGVRTSNLIVTTVGPACAEKAK